MRSSGDQSKENQGSKNKKKKKRMKEKKKPKEWKIKIRKIVKEWEIWDKEEEVAKLEEVRKMVPEKFHRSIYIFGKKASKWIPTRKLWNHAIEIKEGFLLRKRKVYPLSREEREEVHKFISEQLRKGYIRPSKSPQIALVFFVENKDGKKWMVQDYRYLNWMDSKK